MLEVRHVTIEKIHELLVYFAMLETLLYLLLQRIFSDHPKLQQHQYLDYLTILQLFPAAQKLTAC